VHTMKAYRGVEVQLHSFLTMALDGSQWSVSLPGSFSPRRRATVLIEQEARSAPEAVWTYWSRENYLASVSCRPVRSQVLTTLVRLLGKVRGTHKSFIYCPVKKRVKQTHYRPGQAQMVPEG